MEPIATTVAGLDEPQTAANMCTGDDARPAQAAVPDGPTMAVAKLIMRLATPRG